VDNTHFAQFGGENLSGKLSELHMLWNVPPLETWVPFPDDGTLPTARAFHALAGRPTHNGAYLFGGDDGTLRNDLWSYRAYGDTTAAFRQLGFLGDTPAARAGASATWDERNQRLIIVGGRTAASTWTTDLFTVNFYDKPGK
jgi:hypothetical protein